MRLSRERSSAIRRVLDAETDNFVELAIVSGLDPASDFRGAFLKNIDFAGSDLEGFDFTGSQVIECKFTSCKIGNAVFDDVQFSMTDLSRAVDWQERNNVAPIQYLKWLPEKYYERPTSSKTIGKVIGFDGSVAIVDVGRGLCRRFQSQNLQPLLEKRPVAAGDTIALPEHIVEESPPYFYDTEEEEAPPLTREDILQAYESREIVRGMIYRAVKGGFLVNIATFKAFLPGSQVDRYRYQNIAELMRDPQPFLVVGVGGIYPDDLVVSRLAAIELAEEEMRQALFLECYVGQRTEGYIAAMVPHGAFVDIGGVMGLLPRKEMRFHKMTNTDSLEVGKSLVAVIAKKDTKREKLVLSLKPLADNLWSEIEYGPGQIVKGKVSSIVPYGAFIELGMYTGLLHQSEMSFDKKAVAHEILEVGQEISVEIMDVDTKQHKISLSLKSLLPDPWLQAEGKYRVGGETTGRVVSITFYGAFVELELGIVGLVHRSVMGWQPLDQGQGYSPEGAAGNEVAVLVTGIDSAQRRISLSFCPPNDPYVAFAAIYPPGSTVKGEAIGIQNGGIQVKLPGGLLGCIESAIDGEREGFLPAPEGERWLVAEVDTKTGKIVLSHPPADEDSENSEEDVSVP